MSPLPDDPSLRNRFRELRARDAAGARGFVCILDLRRIRQDIDGDPGLRAWAAAMLGAAALVVAGVSVAVRPVPRLKLDDAAVQLAAWESPTGFLLAADFSPTQPN
jgi:hypothetical protein